MNTGKFDCKNRFCTIIKKKLHFFFFRIISGMDLSRESFTNKKSSSLLYYTPKSQMDYGTVLCVASNIVGRQIVPCIYHVIPAGMTQFFCSFWIVYIFIFFAKGQKKSSRCFLQKMNEQILLYYYKTSGQLVFVCFLEEIEGTKKTFQNSSDL